jgi:hypothetical protein
MQDAEPVISPEPEIEQAVTELPHSLGKPLIVQPHAAANHAFLAREEFDCLGKKLIQGHRLTSFSGGTG